MQNIVLMTRENSVCITHVSVFLCNRYDEATIFSGFINHLALAEGEKFYARRILMGQEYTLEKRTQMVFEDLVNLDDRLIQRILRDVDNSVLAQALSDSSEAIRNKILLNMSRRAGVMLRNDIEDIGTIEKTYTDNARSVIMEAYDTARALDYDEKIEEIFAECSQKNKKSEEQTTENTRNDFWTNYDEEKTYIVLVMRGAANIAERVSVMLFDTAEGATNCCEFLNKLKPSGDFFIYARRVEQMVEYETEKPLLVRFDKIFDYDDKILGTALAQVGYGTILSAIKGLDGHSKEKILLSAPEWLQEKVQTELETMKDISKKYKASFSSMTLTKFAQQRIVDAMIAIDRKNRKAMRSDEPQVLMA
jgi:hypothetical protein